MTERSTTGASAIVADSSVGPRPPASHVRDELAREPAVLVDMFAWFLGRCAQDRKAARR
jgi:hypothetical protein